MTFAQVCLVFIIINSGVSSLEWVSHVQNFVLTKRPQKEFGTKRLFQSDISIVQ